MRQGGMLHCGHLHVAVKACLTLAIGAAVSVFCGSVVVLVKVDFDEFFAIDEACDWDR